MVVINPKLCSGCRLCAANCAAFALSTDSNGTVTCNANRCYACGQCVALCPSGAVTMPDLETPVPYESKAFDLNPDILLNAMRFRRSIRRFTGEKLTRDELQRLLDAGRCSPTSTNSQTIQFVVLDSEFEIIRPKIWESFARVAEERKKPLLLRRYKSYLQNPDQPDRLFYGGNQMIAVTSERAVDGGLALANIELMAHAMGLGSLYCGFATTAINADPDLREYFGITEKRHLDSCLIVGHTDLRFQRTAPRNPPNVLWR